MEEGVGLGPGLGDGVGVGVVGFDGVVGGALGLGPGPGAGVMGCGVSDGSPMASFIRMIDFT